MSSSVSSTVWQRSVFITRTRKLREKVFTTLYTRAKLLSQLGTVNTHPKLRDIVTSETNRRRLPCQPCPLHRVPTLTDKHNPKGVLPFDVASAATGVASGVVDGCLWSKHVNQGRDRDFGAMAAQVAGQGEVVVCDAGKMRHVGTGDKSGDKPNARSKRLTLIHP